MMYSPYDDQGYQGYGYPPGQRNQVGRDELVTVQTLPQVEQVPVAPGNRKYVLVQNEPVIAARFADMVTGLATTDYFRLEKFIPGAASPALSGPQAEYITAEQLEARLAAFADSLSKPAQKSRKGEQAE